MKISLAVEVAVRPEEVFPWLDDPEKAMLWQKGVKKAEIIQATPDRIGTTFVEEMEEDGNALQMHGVITAYAPNRMIAFHLESRIHQVDACYSIVEEDGCSVVRVESSVRWKFPMNMISLIMGRRIKEGILKQMQEELGQLRMRCEEEKRGGLANEESVISQAG